MRTVDQVIADIDAVQIEDVQRVAERVIRSDKMAMAMVGPFEDAEPFQRAMEF